MDTPRFIIYSVDGITHSANRRESYVFSMIEKLTHKTIRDEEDLQCLTDAIAERAKEAHKKYPRCAELTVSSSFNEYTNHWSIHLCTAKREGYLAHITIVGIKDNWAK